MLARVVALAVALALGLTGATAPAEAAKTSKRVPACKTKKASKKAAKQPRRKRACRPRARHLRKATKPPAPAPVVPLAPAAPPAAPDLAPVAPVAGDVPLVPTDPTCGPSPNLGVTAEDAGGFRLRLTRTCVPAGLLSVNWRNTDQSDHDLWAMPVGSTPGEVQQVIPRSATTEELPLSGEVTLTAGRWELFCSLPGHGAMRAAVTVAP